MKLFVLFKPCCGLFLGNALDIFLFVLRFLAAVNVKEQLAVGHFVERFLVTLGVAKLAYRILFDK